MTVHNLETKIQGHGIPASNYTSGPYDKVLLGDQLIGVSASAGYTTNIGGRGSVAVVDKDKAVDGAEGKFVIDEEGGGSAKPTVERHVQRTIHTVVTVSPMRATSPGPPRTKIAPS